MPSDYIGKYNITSKGIPVRLKVYDPKETQKFYIPKGRSNLKLSNNDISETGFVAYFDYYLEEDGSITTGYAFVHPFHKNKKILANIGLFFETVIPSTASLEISEISSEYVYKVVEKLKIFKTIYPEK